MARRDKGKDDFFSGLIMAAIFGFLYFSGRGFFWIFPFAFLGVIPAIQGLRRMRNSVPQIKQKREEEDKLSQAAKEKKILSVAAAEGGKVTPAIIALKTTLSIEEAEKILSSLTSRGYATMEINSAGRIEYHFPEFLPPGKGLE